MASGALLAAPPAGDGRFIRRAPGPDDVATADLQRQLNEAKKLFNIRLRKADKSEASYPFPICLSGHIDASGETSRCFDIDGGLLVELFFRGSASYDANGFAGSVKVCQQSGASLPRRLSLEMEARILAQWKRLTSQRQQGWAIDKLLTWVTENLATLLSSVPSELEAYQTCGEDGMTARRFFFKADSTDDRHLPTEGHSGGGDCSSMGKTKGRCASPAVANCRAQLPAEMPAVPSSNQQAAAQAETNGPTPAPTGKATGSSIPLPGDGKRSSQLATKAMLASAEVRPSPRQGAPACGGSILEDEFPGLALSALWRRYAPVEVRRDRAHGSLSVMLTVRPTDPEWRAANLPPDVRVTLELALVRRDASGAAAGGAHGDKDSSAPAGSATAVTLDQASSSAPAVTSNAGTAGLAPPQLALMACSLLPAKGIPPVVVAAANRMLARQASMLGAPGAVAGDVLRQLVRFAENHLGAWEWGEVGEAKAGRLGADRGDDSSAALRGDVQGRAKGQAGGAGEAHAHEDSDDSGRDSQDELPISEESWEGDSEGEGSSPEPHVLGQERGALTTEGRAPPLGADDGGEQTRDAQGGRGRARPRPHGAAGKDTWRRRWELFWDGLEMDNVGTAELVCLRLHVACGRCGVGGAEVALVPAGGAAGGGGVCSSTSECQHCHACWTVEMQPRVAHASSNVVALLRGEATAGAPILDVLPSDVGVSCLECDAVCSLRGVAAGKRCDKVCRACGHGLALTFASTQFRQIVTGRDDPGGQHRSDGGGQGGKGGCKTSESSQSDAYSKLVGGFGGLQLGQELPNRGACQHYHHSYRWLRFPCCGRLFPCDLCHELAMPSDKCASGVWASRMVCGLCSKEQPFDPQRCSWCMQRIASGRAQTGRPNSRFWEGGKGTRDKHRMNRNDPHKYRNSKLKTTSKKAERVGDAPKKRLQRGQKKENAAD